MPSMKYIVVNNWTKLFHIGKDVVIKVPAISIFTIIKCLITVGIGAYYDARLYNFLRKRNQQVGPGQVQLVPWKSTNNVNSENIIVPIRATIGLNFLLFLNSKLI